MSAMSPTLESVFGPASSPVSVTEFIRSSVADKIAVGLTERDENEYR